MFNTIYRKVYSLDTEGGTDWIKRSKETILVNASYDISRNSTCIRSYVFKTAEDTYLVVETHLEDYFNIVTKCLEQSGFQFNEHSYIEPHGCSNLIVKG